jgi:hypothetical protein
MSNILIYQDKDGLTKIEVRLENETLWITQQQMAELFQTTKQNVSLHINNIYKEGELQELATVKDFLTVQHALIEYNKYQKQLGSYEADELDKYLKRLIK